MERRRHVALERLLKVGRAAGDVAVPTSRVPVGGVAGLGCVLLVCERLVQNHIATVFDRASRCGGVLGDSRQSGAVRTLLSAVSQAGVDCAWARLGLRPI